MPRLTADGELAHHATVCDQSDALPQIRQTTVGSLVSAENPAYIPGAMIGAYELLKPLGKGGMGIVFEARRPAATEAVALKTVRTAHPYLLSSIRREIQRLRRLSHPGVVRILDDGTHAGLPWYAMELLEGRTLEQEIEWSSESGPKSANSSAANTDTMRGNLATLNGSGAEPAPNQSSPVTFRDERGPLVTQAIPGFLAVVRQLCDALVYIHGEGVVHRDIKPSNVFVRDDDQPVLVDFGLVLSYIGPDGREVLQVDSTMGGTIAYMAPEQLYGELVDARADIFALGCILYEGLTGQLPFPATIQSRIKCNFAAPPRPSLVSPAVEPWLDSLVLQMLAADRRDRVGHASDVLAVLAERAKVTVPVSDVIIGSTRSYLYRAGFAGRSGILSDLTNRARQLSLGTGEFILLHGESGSGKTRLLSELVRQATSAKVSVIASECPPIDVTPNPNRVVHHGPLAPLRPCLLHLADLCRTSGVGHFEGLQARHLLVLAAIEPALGELPEVSVLSDAQTLLVEAVRHRVLTAAVEAIVALSKRAPLLLVFDDLQWADELTLDLLSYLASDVVRHARLMIVGGFRSEETTVPLAALAEGQNVLTMSLERLDTDAVGMLVADMLAVSSPPLELVNFVAEHAAGNPFFISEYLHTIVDEGLLRRNRYGEWALADAAVGKASTESWLSRLQRLELPRTLRAIVERRLRGLEPQLAEVVAIGALLGREFGAELLSELCGLSEPTLADALNDAIRRQILETAGGGRYRFTHDKLREAAYESISAVRKRELHSAAAVAMERRGVGATELTELANHFSKAEIPGKAIEYLRRASEQALGAGAHQQAVPLLARAFEHADSPGSSTTKDERAKLHRLYADALFGIGDSDGSVFHAEAALTALGMALPQTTLRWVLMLLVQCAEQLLRITKEPVVDVSAADSDEERRIELALAAGRLSSSYFSAHQSQLLVMTATFLAANLADRAGPRGARSLPYSILGCTAGFFRMDRLSALYFKRAREDAQRRGDRAVEAVIAIPECSLCQGMARWDSLVSLSEAAEAIAEQVDDRLAFEALHLIRGGSELLTGELSPATRRLGDIVRGSEGRGALLNHGWASAMLGIAELWSGRPQSARELARISRKDFARDRGSAVANALAVEATANWLLGDKAAALALAQESLGALARGPVLFQMWPACSLLSWVLLELWEEAQQTGSADEHLLRKTALAACRATSALGRICPIGGPFALRAWGVVARIRGQHTRAAKRLAAAMERAEQLRMPVALAEACIELGRTLKDDAKRREQILQRARQVATKVGCPLLAERAQKLLTQT